MNKPISIVVPTHNHSEFLNECLESVFHQTFEGWECIIVNDGSTDNTAEIVQAWLEKDVRFKYIEIINSGVSAARNKGIEMANGEWILPLDSDDIINPQYLEKAIPFFKEENQVVYCQAELFGDRTGIWDLPDFEFPLILIKNLIFCSAFYKKSDWLKIGGYDESFSVGYEDWEFWIHLLSKYEIPKVIRLNYIGFRYRIKKQSRNEDLMRNERQMNATRNQIFIKHLEVYEQEYGSMQSIALQNMKLKSKNKTMDKSIRMLYKNIVTRILYKMIRLIAKFELK